MEATLLIIDALISLVCFILIIVILQRDDVWRKISTRLSGWRESLLRLSFTMMAGGFFWKMVMKTQFTIQDILIDGGIVLALVLFIRSNQIITKNLWQKG